MSGKSVPAPNHTQTPNVFFDEMLPEIETMSELKVTLAVIRQTFGWHKEEDQLSLSQLEQITGMNRQQVVAGCKAAIARGYVWREKRSGRNYFGINVVGYEDNTPKPDRGMKNIPPASREIIPTKETEKESNDSSLRSESAGKPPKRANGITKLMDRVNDAREGGEDVTALPQRGRKSIGEFYRQYELDGASSEHLEWALDYMVAKASGKIEGEPKAWCGFGTAMDKVRLDGWRPKARLRAVRDPEHEKMIEENARLEQELIDEALGAS